MATNTLTSMTTPTMRGIAIAARVVAAALTAAMAVIHYHLWSTGYRHIHVIGILFLLNAIGGVLLAVALLLTPIRLLAVTALLAALFTAGTLAGLIVSLHTPLFGFQEYAGVPYEHESIVLESIGTAVTAVMAAAGARTTLAWYRQIRRAQP